MLFLLARLGLLRRLSAVATAPGSVKTRFELG